MRKFALTDLNEREYRCVEIDPPSEEIQQWFRNSKLIDAQALRAGEPGTWVEWVTTGQIGWLPKSKQIEVK